MNVDTFRNSLVRRRSVPIRPSEHVEGRFAPAKQVADGFYVNTTGPGPALARMVNAMENPQNSQDPSPPLFRQSNDSVFTISSDCGSSSVITPQNVETLLMSEEDQKKLYYARQGRAAAGSVTFDGNNSENSFDDGVALRPMVSAFEHDDLGLTPPPGAYHPGRSESTPPVYTEPESVVPSHLAPSSFQTP